MNRRIIKTILFLCLVLVCFLTSACQKAPFLSISGEKTMSFPNSGGTESFSMSCNRDWTVTSSEEWLIVSPMMGGAFDDVLTITVICGENTTVESRTAAIIVHSGDMTENISVTQEPMKGVEISPDAESIRYTYEEQSLELKVSSNIKYTVDIDKDSPWISLVETKSVDLKTYVFRISSNETGYNRTGRIWFLDDNGDKLKEVEITQIWKRGAEPEPDFCEAVELIILVFRLAGAPEFNTCDITSINQSVDSFFKEVTDHQAVSLAKAYRSRGVSYDAVAAYGLNLLISDTGVITFNPDYAEGGCSSFERWSPQQKFDMLAALNDFYRQSDFHKWYLSTEQLRNQAVAAFNEVCDVDYSWFDSFYGPVEKLSRQITLSILNGSNNFGISIMCTDGTSLLSPVFGSPYQDSSGNLHYGSSIYQTIIHEFSHPYCNPLVDKYWSQMSEKAEMIYKTVEESMKSLAYGNPQTMMNETLVRSSVVRYILSHKGDGEAEARIRYDEGKGFVLMRTVSSVMEKKEQDPDKYPTLDSLMPDIVKAINEY